MARTHCLLARVSLRFLLHRPLSIARTLHFLSLSVLCSQLTLFLPLVTGFSFTGIKYFLGMGNIKILFYVVLLQ